MSCHHRIEMRTNGEKARSWDFPPFCFGVALVDANGSRPSSVSEVLGVFPLRFGCFLQ